VTPPAARRVLVIANPAAGLKRGRPAGEAAARAARRAGAYAHLYLTSGPGDAQAAASRDAGAFDLVLAAGGDGTVHEVANGLAGTGVPLGVAPSGTMNLLARVLRLPLDPAEAAARLVSRSGRLTVRPGRANGRLFLLMAGFGFDAWVLRELLRAMRGKIGFLDYARGALRGLRSFPFAPLDLTVDGVATNAHSAIVGRAPLYGGFLRPTPHVILSDGPLEICALSAGPWRLAALLPRLWSGAHGGGIGVTLAPATRIAARAAEEIPFQLDGELSGVLPLDLDLADRTVVLAVPKVR
jgi:diacylglycerol kinase (ATP)